MIVFLLFVLVLALICQVNMAAHALENLSGSLRCRDYLVEPDAPFTLEITLQNHSRLPVLFLRCLCTVPVAASLCPGQRGRLNTLVHTAEYEFHCFLLPRQTLVHQVQLTLPKRGCYPVRNLRLSAGDFFGLKEEEERFPGSCEVVVLPPRPDTTASPEVYGGLMGEQSVLRWIHEDPILSAGFRDYTGREPLKTVNWNRSLQSGKLMVRQMDHTAEEKITVLLNVNASHRENVERSFSLCRGICEELERRSLPFAFLHNGTLQTGVGILPPLESGLGPQHLNRILESLGRAELTYRESLETMTRRAILRSQESGSFLLLTAEQSPEVTRAASRLETVTGGSVRIISAEGML